MAGTKIKCTCPGQCHQAAREECAVFGRRLVHTWPGKEDQGRGREAVTLEDVRFLDRLPRHPMHGWWHKLWGRPCKKATG